MRNYLWAVEEQWGDREWLAWQDSIKPTREQARQLQRKFKRDGCDDTRIRKYQRVESSK